MSLMVAEHVIRPNAQVADRTGRIWRVVGSELTAPAGDTIIERRYTLETDGHTLTFDSEGRPGLITKTHTQVITLDELIAEFIPA